MVQSCMQSQALCPVPASHLAAHIQGVGLCDDAANGSRNQHIAGDCRGGPSWGQQWVNRQNDHDKPPSSMSGFTGWHCPSAHGTVPLLTRQQTLLRQRGAGREGRKAGVREVGGSTAAHWKRNPAIHSGSQLAHSVQPHLYTARLACALPPASPAARARPAGLSPAARQLRQTRRTRPPRARPPRAECALPRNPHCQSPVKGAGVHAAVQCEAQRGGGENLSPPPQFLSRHCIPARPHLDHKGLALEVAQTHGAQQLARGEDDATPGGCLAPQAAVQRHRLAGDHCGGEARSLGELCAAGEEEGCQDVAVAR